MVMISLFSLVLLSIPAEPPHDAPAVEAVRVAAADGAVLRGQRLRGSGTPVVLVHGLAASFHQFDLDAEGAPALAQFLARRGHDVWLWNLRGAGRGDDESTLAPGRRRWCADEHIVEDLPAIIADVRAATGERPFLLGHILHALAGYLAGEDRAGAVPRGPEGQRPAASRGDGG